MTSVTVEIPPHDALTMRHAGVGVCPRRVGAEVGVLPHGHVERLDHHTRVVQWLPPPPVLQIIEAPQELARRGCDEVTQSNSGLSL
jgi:hypothetical protein